MMRGGRLVQCLTLASALGCSTARVPIAPGDPGGPREQQEPREHASTNTDGEAASVEAHRADNKVERDESSGAILPQPGVAPTSESTAPKERRGNARDTVKRDSRDKADLGGYGGGGTPAGGGPTRVGASEPAPISPPTRVLDAAPAIKAGRHDDNAQYNRFLGFLGENGSAVVYPVNVTERLVVRTTDKDGRGIGNCAVQVKSLVGEVLARGTTYADGRTHFFPLDAGKGGKEFTVSARCAGAERNGQLSRAGKRETEVRFPSPRAIAAQVPVDIAIVFDTTGSMQSQIDRLKRTLQAIHVQLVNLSTRPLVRFGLVAYRDRGDDYVTQVTPFTDDVEAFQRAVDRLDADGGGDTPEDLQAALDDALHKLAWGKDALRLGFVIADAVPHTDYGQRFDYREAMRESLERGIKWTTIGAGGLPRAGEVIFRQIAQYTMGEYVFVTEAGGDDHEGGVGEASHHVGTNYKTENLDQAIVRIVRRELSHMTDTPVDFDYTLVAAGPVTTAKDGVLAAAVAEALEQLVGYSAMRLTDRTSVAVVPVSAPKDHADIAEYLSAELALRASRMPAFRLVERDLHAVSQELKLQLSELVDVKDAVPLGKLVGAELLIVTKLSVKDGKADLFARLVRVETGEVLSVAKVALTDGIKRAALTQGAGVSAGQ